MFEIRAYARVGVETGSFLRKEVLMRLADFIRQASGKPLGRFYREGAFVLDGLPVSLAAVPDELPVYSADAICEYLFAGTAQEVWELRSDFPGCLPQHADLFVEMRRPSRIRSEATGTTFPSTMPTSWGWFISGRRRSDLALDRRPEYVRQIRDRLLGSAGDQIDTEAVDSAMRSCNPMRETYRLNEAERCLLFARTQIGEQVTASARTLPPVRPASAPGWMIWASQICAYDGTLTVGPWTFKLDLDETGTVAAVPSLHGRGRPSLDAWWGDVSQADTFSQLFPALLALSLVNRGQANIQRRDPPADLNRRRKKRGEPLLQSYWSIERKEGASS